MIELQRRAYNADSVRLFCILVVSIFYGNENNKNYDKRFMCFISIFQYSR